MFTSPFLNYKSNKSIGSMSHVLKIDIYDILQRMLSIHNIHLNHIINNNISL